MNTFWFIDPVKNIIGRFLSGLGSRIFDSYIGETKRSFKVRTNKHKRAVKNQNVDKNEIVDHCWKNDHEINWEEWKVIDAEPYIYARKIKENYSFN